jgi:hypothetical protein
MDLMEIIGPSSSELRAERELNIDVYLMAI